MEKSVHEQIVSDAIEQGIATLLPHGAGPVTDFRLRIVLERVGKIAFREGESYALLNLLTVADVAAQLGVSERRVRVIATERHARFGVGFQVPGTHAWLFRPEEVDSLRPGPAGRPRQTRPHATAANGAGGR